MPELTPLSQLPISGGRPVQQFAATPLRAVTTPTPYLLALGPGDAIPLPGSQPIPVTSDAAYYLTHAVPTTLGASPISAGEYEGQRIQLICPLAALTVPSSALTPGGPFTVAAASSATLTWVGGQWTIQGAFAPVAVERAYKDRSTPGTTTSSTPIVYQTLSGVVAGGVYKLLGFLQISGSQPSTQIEAQFVLDGFPLGGPLQETGISDGRFGFSAYVELPLAPGAHTLDIRYAKHAGAGSVTAQLCAISWERVSAL